MDSETGRKIDGCGIPSPKLNPVMVSCKFPEKGESEREQKEMKENDMSRI